MLREWAREREAQLTQVEVPGQQQVVAPIGPAQECEVVVAIGGDGTALAAIRAAAPRERPVLGVACGSLGVLTSVPAAELSEALTQFGEGRWRAVGLPALEVRREHEETVLAYNDVVIVRRGQGQARCSVRVDGGLFARLAGDGCIVSTPVGSSAYAFAAGGPLLAHGSDAFLLTPLSNHGGSCPPLVMGAESRLQIEVAVSLGARLELDGKIAEEHVDSLDICLRRRAATLVTLEGQETFLARLRRRGVISDSLRVLAEGERRAAQR